MSVECVCVCVCVEFGISLIKSALSIPELRKDECLYVCGITNPTVV
jgi:hypothetical protein